MKKFFVHELKRSLLTIGAIATVLTIITVVEILTYRYDIYSYPESGIGVLTFMTGVLAAVTPIWMFSYKMKRRSADMYYSLPVTRTQILKARFLLGMIAIYAPYTVAFLHALLAAIIKYPMAALRPEYYAPFYFASLPALFIIYAVSSFAFTRANRVIDGVIFIAMWMVAPSFVVRAMERALTITAPGMYYAFSPLSVLSERLVPVIERRETLPWVTVLSENAILRVNMGVAFSLSTLAAIASTLFLFLTEKHARAEDIGGISDTKFGYKVMLPLLTVCLIANSNIVYAPYTAIYTIVLLTGAVYMLYALYRHTFAIGKVSAIVFGASVATGLTLAVVVGMVTRFTLGISIY